jgi:hypothetical protein
MADTESNTKTKDRSPNFPACTWVEAIDYAKMIWDHEKRHPLSLELAAKHMGYKGLSGASLPAIAALKQYGLLVQEGKDVRISDDANKILLYPVGSPETVDIVNKSAMRPPLFSKVLAKFPDGLPSDANLRARLQHEWKFASDKAAERFIKVLREAVSVVGDVALANERINVDIEANDIGEATMSDAIEAAIKTPQPAITAQGAGTSQRPTQGTQSRPWDLGDGAMMTAVIPVKLTKKNIARMKKYVEALEVEASIAWEDDEANS